MLSTVESYLFRRTVCDCPTNSLQKFFSSLIGRLDRVQEDEGSSYVEAFEAFLLNEAGTARRFPTDAEFSDPLRTRDAYHFRRSLYLLSRLENSYHPKDERDFTTGSYTIECTGVSDTATFIGVPFSGGVLESSARNSLIWSTVVGVTGVGVLILGIVLVARANKRRRDIQVDIMMSGIQRQ